MMADGYSEDMLTTAFDRLCENEKTARGFLAKNARLRKLWLDSSLFSQLWVFGCFMLTVTVALGINFCCSTSIDVPLYYICSLLYYWEDTIAQIMYLYCSNTTCRYHFCTPWRCNAKHLNDWCGCFYLNIMSIFKWLFLMLKWMNIFVLLQMCLVNADGWIWMNIFVLLQVCLGNAGAWNCYFS